MERNWEYYSQWLAIDGVLSEYERGLLFDPQTSGGLLMSVAADRAAELLADLHAAGEDAFILGDVVGGMPGNIVAVKSG